MAHILKLTEVYKLAEDRCSQYPSAIIREFSQQRRTLNRLWFVLQAQIKSLNS